MDLSPRRFRHTTFIRVGASPRRHLEFPFPSFLAQELGMNLAQEVARLLDEVLSLKGRSLGFTRETHLLGAVPELDSMAVVSFLTGLEERFDIVIDDTDIDGEVFSTVGSLTDFVADKLSRRSPA